MNDKGWTLKSWTEYFTRVNGEHHRPLTPGEIESARVYLRDRHYPKPLDCPGTKCTQHSYGCECGICSIAIDICEDHGNVWKSVDGGETNVR